jgi:predicted acetyltransferase
LKARVEEERPSKREELINAIMAAWDKLLMTIVNSVVGSIPRRIQKVYDKKGGHIGY